jgi:hypothetical protein
MRLKNAQGGFHSCHFSHRLLHVRLLKLSSGCMLLHQYGMINLVQAPTALISEVTNRQPHVESHYHPGPKGLWPVPWEPTLRDEANRHSSCSLLRYIVNHLNTHSFGDSHSHFGSFQIRQPYNHNQVKRSSPMRGVNLLSSPVQGLPAACVRSIVGHR